MLQIIDLVYAIESQLSIFKVEKMRLQSKENDSTSLRGYAKIIQLSVV